MIDQDRIRTALQQLEAGATDVASVLQLLSTLDTGDLGFARIDHHRALRCGFPEVIYGAGKTPAQIVGIAREFLARGTNVYATRLTPETAATVQASLPAATYDPSARTLSLIVEPPTPRPGRCLVVTAGTSDQPVAQEAVNTLHFFGYDARLLADVGVAGIHRLLARQDELHACDVLIVVAGMEGALPSVVGGLVPIPVIGVPTSVGYGAHLAGFTPLLAMLNSCASGITITNIDNGFGAACAAARILSLRARPGPDASPPDATRAAPASAEGA